MEQKTLLVLDAEEWVLITPALIAEFDHQQLPESAPPGHAGHTSPHGCTGAISLSGVERQHET